MSRSNSSQSPSKAREQTQAKIRRKVELLQQWKREGIPEGSYVPASEVKFREWSDNELGLESWSSPNVLNEPWNTDFKVEANRLIRSLKAGQTEQKKRKAIRANQLVRYQQRINELEQHQGRLASQYTMTRDAMERYERRLVRASRTIEDLTARLQEYESIPRISK